MNNSRHSYKHLTLAFKIKSSRMATIDDWRMPKIVHFSGIENTEHSIKDISARPKKSTNKELSKQASTETRVVVSY